MIEKQTMTMNNYYTDVNDFENLILILNDI